jgi:hypothetical protein
VPLQGAPFPTEDELVNAKRKATQPFIDWATALSQTVDASPSRTGSAVELTTQTASIGATPVPTGALATGYFRVTFYARITQAATVSISLTLTLGFTDDSVACALSGAALTGNTTATTQSLTFLVRNDQASALTYSTTYASVGATAMQYKLSVIVERVQA